ncbi:hypothetical protein CCMSSC00406_0009370 [Pleurotus cornucopiae]|uniref:Uncharacterized protein n=1 Tax=Pleurotus cornucopiae TaxID=5321 RepID=A0ACB7ITF1_PLECO|nr:hypothetical protein CCMSSC00406_0009370 [Pleurotus cornucopiae]
MSSPPPSSPSITQVYSSPIPQAPDDWARLKLQTHGMKGKNLATYNMRADEVVVLPYPLNAFGELIPPSLLWSHAQTHAFPMPTCFHGVVARMFKVTNSEKWCNGHTVYACGLNSKKLHCSMFVSVDLVYASEQLPTSQVYPRIPFTSTLLPTATRRSRFPDPLPVAPRASVSDASRTRMKKRAERREMEKPYMRAPEGSGRTILDPIQFDSHPSPSPPSSSRRFIPQTVSLGQHSATPRGVMRFIWDLSEDGIPLELFNTMFVQCPGCKKVLVGEAYDFHMCDISEL